MRKELSPREVEVCRLAAAGLVNKEIAASLGIRVSTVLSYWERAFIKLRARCRTHAVAIWLGGSGNAHQTPAAPAQVRPNG